MSKSERTAYLTKIRKPNGFDKNWIEFANRRVYFGEFPESQLAGVQFGKHFVDWVWRAMIANFTDMLIASRNDPAEIASAKDHFRMFMLPPPCDSRDREYYRAYASLIRYGRSGALAKNSTFMGSLERWCVDNVPLKRPRRIGMIGATRHASEQRLTNR